MMWRLAQVVVVALSLAGACAATAVQVVPAPGTRLGEPPVAVRVAQEAPVEPGLAGAASAGPRGAVSRAVRVSPDDPQAVLVPVVPDGPGTYRVAWWGMTTDGHPFSGSTSFRVRSTSPAAPAVVPEGHADAGVLAVAARFLVLIGVVGTAGMAVVREWVMGGAWRSGGIAPPGVGDTAEVRDAARQASGSPGRAWWRAWWALLLAWGVGLAVALPVQALAIGGQWAGLLGDSRWGMAWIGLVVLAAAAALAGAIGRRADRPVEPAAARMYALAIPGLLAAVLLSWSGHAASGTDPTLGVAIDVAHGWATAAWLGGLVMLLVLAMPVLGAMPDTARVRLGAAVIVRFSAVAVVAVVVLVVTGIYRALAELPSLDVLWGSSYGLALLVKLVVFALMLVLAAWNRLVLHPRLERTALGLGVDDDGGITALRASVRAEVALGAAVMMAVAVLVILVPPS